MRRGIQAVERGRHVRRGHTVAARAAAFLLAVGLLAAPALQAQGTPAGTQISNWASFSFIFAGNPYTLPSDTATVLVGQVAGVSLLPPRVSSGAAGSAVVFSHTLTNTGNGVDSFTVAAVSARGWPVTLYRDANANGFFDAGDTVLTAPVPLARGAAAALLAQVAVPGGASVGVSDTVTLTATSRFNAAVGSSVQDRLDVTASGAVTIALTKQVDRLTAVTGDVLTYTLDYTASGSGADSNVALADTIPAGVSYLAGSLRWNGAPLTDATGDDAGSFVAGGNGMVVVSAGAVTGGTAGTVTFQATVDPGPARTVANRGHATYVWAGASDTAYSNVAQTNVLVPALTLSKQLVGPSPALVGQQVQYRLRYGDAAGAAAVSNVVLTDTLPVGLNYVSAVPAPTTVGAVLSWAIGALAPGDTGSVDLVLQVSNTVQDTVWATNVAALEGTNATAQRSSAPQVALIGPPTAVIGLDLTANALDVAVGEVIPYTVVARNSGIVALSAIRIDHALFTGGHYVPGSAIGADSVLVSAGHLILVSSAALAPGATRTLHFAVALASAPGTIASVQAIASARAGALQPVSPPAIAWVQVRRAWPMETRAAIGKVFVDRQSGDSGLAGVDIWTEDGQVATTDSTGKFSFANLRPGHHAFRLDPRTLPPGSSVAGDDIQAVEASGWTTPHVDFRVLPGAQVGAETGAQMGMDRDAAAAAGATDVEREAERAHTGAERQVAPSAQSGGGANAAWSQDPKLVRLQFAAVPVSDSDSTLRSGARPRVRYEVTLKKAAQLPLDALVDFSPVADSALVFAGDTQFTRYTWLGTTAIPVPVGRARTEFRIVAWSSARGDSATVTLRVGRSRVSSRVAISDSRQPSGITLAVRRVARTYAARSGQMIEVVPEPLPLARASDSVAAPAVPAPAVLAPAVPRVTVPGARRVMRYSTGLQAAALVTGPGTDIFSPQDGTVLPANRVYVGVKGEPNEPVVLYDGAQAIDSGRMRIDGVHDFIAVPLTPGPHLLRVAMKNTWGVARWDSIAVHVTGLPAQFSVGASRLTLVADGHTVATAKVQVLDSWGVPVVQPAYVTVSATGADPVGVDAAGSSVGLQQLSDSAGWLTVSLRPGRQVRRGALELKSGDAHATVALEILPEVRPLTITGSGLVGVGASPDAYGAITARGRLDARTSLTLGLDSRRLNDGREMFGRATDPLAEAQYPILGDASPIQTRTASQNWVSARLEHGFDSAHVTTGAITWSGFGSLTSQALGQMQLRGAGVSGPYQLGANMMPGTDYLRIETRDAANPERAVVTQALTRFVDYEIDYTSGAVLFKQAIPAADANGNPVFIVATFEAASGGEQRLVAGGRAALDLRGLAGDGALDSLRIGVSAVQADQGINQYRLVSGDVRALRVGALDLAAEAAYTEQGDSTGFGALAKASYSAWHGAFTLGAGYMRIDREFTNPSNVALQPGLTEVSVKTGLKFGATQLVAEHASEQFALQGVSRDHSRVGLVQSLLPNLQLDAGVANDQVTGGLIGGLGWSDATAADLKAKWAPTSALHLWSEAQRHVSLSGEELSPDFWGFGASYRFAPSLTLDAGQRFVSRADGQGDYSVSNVGVRADIGHGTEAWSSYRLSGGINGAGNAAVLGLRNRLQLTPDLAVNVMFERRMGVSGAAVTDPVRALPFLQAEDNYWSAGAGLELLPRHGPYRLSARGEYKDGALQSTRLATLAGDVAFDASLALLSRQQFTQSALPGLPLSRKLSSLWGLAFRPTRSDRLNMLAKLQWTDERNPLGGGALVSQGAERKVIGAAEMIWTPVPALEIGTRYAMRRTQADAVYPDGTPQALTAWADYLGGRVNIALNRWVSLRGDGRFLVERASGTTTWDGSPALAVRPVNGLEVAGGYRFGDLSDPDFSVRGGHGAFVTLSATLTEKLFPTAAAFWRSRF